MSFSIPGFLLTLLLIGSCTSQKKIIVDDPLLPRIKKHIEYLAHDRLEGRRTGTPGEKLAMQYIAEQFKDVGLTPKGTDVYIQKFPVDEGKKMDDVTELVINGETLQRGKDYFVFPYSPDQKLQALPSVAIQEVGMPWFMDLTELLEENKNNPHFDLSEHLYKHARSGSDKGAVALIYYNSSNIDDKLVFDPKNKFDQLTIPVLYITKTIAKKYFGDKAASLNIKLRTAIGDQVRTGHNVIGFIDNNAATTVVLGAHYDHLGYGEDGNSMIRTREGNIHNGADDNASGTAALIELASLLKKSKAKSNNYLFVAFSGEELGLFGSKYFTENPPVPLKTINYMINMDMIGRLNDSSKTITIGGYGTSPVWGSVIEKTYYTSSRSITPTLNIKLDSSGTGPSDHTSFYRKDIPVLFYFTGLHSDYHKPSDDPEKINYVGTQHIIRHILQLVETVDARGKLVFTKTRETQTTTSARFSVSMGIMPDYTFSGSGVRADGISEGKPAQKAGLAPGDIIIQLGDHTVSSLENYMQALAKFKKGDKVKVRFKRGNQIKETTVEF